MKRAIDHVVVVVEDLDDAARSFQDHGFTVTPIADHPFGTSNRLVVTEKSYLELVSVTSPHLIPASGFAAEIAARVTERRLGIAFLMLKTDDADAEHSALSESGNAKGGVLHFERTAPLVGGGSTRAAFSVAFTIDGRASYCQHHTPGAIWDPAAMRHDNGARRLTAIGFESGVELESVSILGEPGIRFDEGTRAFSIAGMSVSY